VVTDPPYELSDDGKASPARVALELLFPKQAHLVTKGACEFDLAGLARKVLGLCGIRTLPEPPTAVPVVAVALDDDPPHRHHDIEHGSENAALAANTDAGADVEAEQTEHLGCFALEFADLVTMLDALDGAGCGFLSGGLGVGFRVGVAGLPGLLSGAFPIVLSDDDVGFLDDTYSVGVGARWRAEDSAVARLDSGWAPDNDLSAPAALTLFAVLQLGSAKLVRASSPAGRLATKLQARRIRVVSPLTDRTITLDLLVHPQNISSAGFMGKAWDGSKIAYSVDLWREVLRVLKPGGHLLAFGGTRTYHRMTCAIEDAGFEIRDTIAWMYGQGFPKSLDVSKAIDKAAGAAREVVGPSARHVSGKANQRTAGLHGTSTFAESVGMGATITAPATEAAQRWAGWGTALKPAHEPVTVARKPLVGTVAANVQAYGTGAINVDGCRVGASKRVPGSPKRVNASAHTVSLPGYDGGSGHDPNVGRWPANVVLDEDAAAVLDAQTQGVVHSAGRARVEPGGGTYDGSTGIGFSGIGVGRKGFRVGDSGGASRFFYCAKASKRDRGNGNKHPTVKPTALMQWLVRLVTPPGGTVLDPFAGSGTTLVAAKAEGFHAIGIEREAEYVAIIKARVGA